MSPITMALLGLLAYKAIKSMTANQQTSPAPQPAPSPGGGGLGDLLGNARSSGNAPAGGSLGDLLGNSLGGGNASGGGGLGDLLGNVLGGGNARGGSSGGLLGGLGGLLAGGAAGSVLSGGLDDVLKQLQQSGREDVAQSWGGTGPNKEIAPDDLASALGGDRINMMMEQSGMSRDELLGALSEHLPGLIDYLTPEGRLPTDQELSQRL